MPSVCRYPCVADTTRTRIGAFWASTPVAATASGTIVSLRSLIVVSSSVIASERLFRWFDYRPGSRRVQTAGTPEVRAFDRRGPQSAVVRLHELQKCGI